MGGDFLKIVPTLRGGTLGWGLWVGTTKIGWGLWVGTTKIGWGHWVGTTKIGWGQKESLDSEVSHYDPLEKRKHDLSANHQSIFHCELHLQHGCDNWFLKNKESSQECLSVARSLPTKPGRRGEAPENFDSQEFSTPGNNFPDCSSSIL